MALYLRFFIFSLLVFNTNVINAAPILDANYFGTGSPQYPFAVNSNSPVLAETFAALSSGRLTSYSIYAFPLSTGTAGLLRVSLTTTVAGGPSGGSVLVQRELSTAAITTRGLYDFDVSAAGVNVVAGNTYALVTSTTAANPSVAIGGDAPGTYAGGAGYFGQPGTLQLASTTDLFFRIFVDSAPVTPPSSVPEPATAALLGAGLFGLGLVRRKRA